MKKQLQTYQHRVNQQLEQFLNSALTNCPPLLKEAIEYSTLNNGKRLRPALIYAVGEALNVPIEKLDAPAIAIELIHSYSLVHDDLPAMDDDELRRGQPTCHIQYDEATAILVGDAQQTLAFEALTETSLCSDSHKVVLINLLTKAAGSIGMIGGQYIDIQSSGNLPKLEQLKTMHLMKTGALIQTALLMGACQSDRYENNKQTWLLYGEKIGLAFQVHDDILDIESTSEILGKPQGSDEEADKSTYPKLMGLEASKNYRNQLIEEGIDLLDQLEIDSEFLKGLTEYIAQRNH